ncbi:unnamed protein product, partial [Adineta steineri]
MNIPKFAQCDGDYQYLVIRQYRVDLEDAINKAEYENILKKDPRNGEVCIYLACAYFMLGKYDDAEHTALKGPKSPLQTRVLFHVAHKQNNEEKLMNLHRQLQDVIEDQMCLASMHYM